MRVFIAASFDDNTYKSIIDLQNKLVEQGIDGRKTKKENLHMTMFFLGDLEVSTVQALISEFKKMPSLKLELKSRSIDTFYNGTVVLKYHEDRKLMEYREQLRIILDKLNIQYDKKRFTPHITLFRKNTFRVLDNVDNKSIIIGVNIYSSLLTSNGPVYDILV